METDYDAALDYLDWALINILVHHDDCWLEEERWMKLRNYKPDSTKHKLKAGTCLQKDLVYNENELYTSSFGHPDMEKIIKKQGRAEGGDDVRVLSQVHVFRVYPKSMPKFFCNWNYDPYVAPAVVPPWH